LEELSLAQAIQSGFVFITPKSEHNLQVPNPSEPSTDEFVARTRYFLVPSQLV